MPRSDAFTAAGLTYRQLDHWTLKGYLVETGARGKSGPGSARVWAQEELRVARRILKLVKAGLVLETAARVAREGSGEVELAPGVRLIVDESA